MNLGNQSSYALVQAICPVYVHEAICSIVYTNVSLKKNQIQAVRSLSEKTGREGCSLSSTQSSVGSCVLVLEFTLLYFAPTGKRNT